MILNIDGINVNYIDEGNGTNILLLHGWGANIQTMLPIFNMLKSKCRVIALDLPGFGESDRPPLPWNSNDYAICVKKFIDVLGVKKVILFGHSHGGRVSIILSSLFCDLVDKLVLIDSAGVKPKRKIGYYFKIYKYKLLKKIYLQFLGSENRKNRLEKFYRKYGSNDYKNTDGVMRKTIVKVINDNVESLLSNICCPTLLVWGENDSDTPLYMGEKLNKKIKDSGLIILKNAGHYSYVDDYKTFRAVIQSFLSKELS
ncbi:alpha/beta hydrolase [Sedimentibacter sp. zth1]|uniref:alpha/beta fold hydrolase n=1 Tax=Sedimentibacter sp. zth1 TaxID=2816908 RepID=UPI001A913619|nr:alpha/beta hydrolase [Sedimentibacter sp. zth1]QSX06243.1 alpha/beta hydrolase [Sedimentibacter sp. zth1]